jgi:predicted nucleic-acid-binding Zn-ribbon protein
MTTPAGAGSASRPPLSAPCPKCSSDQRTLVCIPSTGADDFDDAPLIRLDPREHMQVTCSACGFVWAAAPADTPEA